MLYPIPRRYFCALAALILLQSPAQAVVLDWDLVTWAAGTLSNSYLVDPVDPNSNVTVTVAPNGGAPLVPFSVLPNPATPAITNGFQGGLPTIENTLTIAVHLDNPLQTITVTIAFGAGGATNVSFKLFDIDAGGGSQDQLTSIRALSIDGTTLIAPVITASPDNTLVGTGLTQSVVGNATTPGIGATSGRGNVLIDFGTNVIQSLSFDYGGTAAFPTPSYQHFAIHDITFTPVPEMNPTFLSVFACLASAGLVYRHRLKTRR
jgi:hypothetical protein